MGGFIERQSAQYNATPGDSAFVIKALDEKKTSTLVELASNFAFFDSYVRKYRALGWILLTFYSSASTRVQLILTASSQPRARPAALLTTPTSLLVSSTMLQEQHVRSQSLKRSARRASAGRMCVELCTVTLRKIKILMTL